MSELITYFGYGANRDRDMIEAISGEQPQGEEAVLAGYELFIQSYDQIPDVVKKILANNWSPAEIQDFRTYGIREKVGSFVVGMAWHITQTGRELVDNWELTDGGLWYRKIDTHIRIGDQSIDSSTEVLDAIDPVELVKDPTNYVNYLMPKERMLEIARKLYKEETGL